MADTSREPTDRPPSAVCQFCKKAVFLIEPQVGLTRVFVWTVAFETVFGKDNANVAIEFNFIRTVGGQRTLERRRETTHHDDETDEVTKSHGVLIRKLNRWVQQRLHYIPNQLRQGAGSIFSTSVRRLAPSTLVEALRLAVRNGQRFPLTFGQHSGD